MEKVNGRLKKSTLEKICIQLRSRRSQSGYEWTDENNMTMQTEYSVVLYDKPEVFGQWLIREILKRFKWRPDTSDLQDMYLEFLGLNPNVQEYYTTLMEIRDRVGPYGVESTKTPGLFLLGEPSEITQSPVLSALVRRCGGWEEFCGEDNIILLRKSIGDAHKSVTEIAKRDPRILGGGTNPLLTSNQKSLGAVNELSTLEGEK